jgi:hypothetical protein
MHTLTWPMRPVNQARAIAGGLCLVGTTLAPLPSPAFTYGVLAGSVIIQHQSTGTPLVWPTPPIAIRLGLGAAGRRLLNGTTSWDENAASALAAWNATVPLFVQHATALNVVRWATPEDGEDLGRLAALTRKEYGTRDGRVGMVQATVLLNPAHCWDAYDGPLRSGLCQGQWQRVCDLQRIVLHELGHVLGLEHPDEGGQTVSAIMNHLVSDLDTLTADDQLGAQFLYPPLAEAPAEPPPPQVVTAALQTAGSGGGCAMGGSDRPDLLLCWLPLVALGAALRRAARGKARQPPGHTPTPGSPARPHSMVAPVRTIYSIHTRPVPESEGARV